MSVVGTIRMKKARKENDLRIKKLKIARRNKKTVILAIYAISIFFIGFLSGAIYNWVPIHFCRDKIVYLKPLTEVQIQIMEEIRDNQQRELTK